jgi:hypothetical protein
MLPNGWNPLATGAPAKLVRYGLACISASTFSLYRVSVQVTMPSSPAKVRSSGFCPVMSFWTTCHFGRKSSKGSLSAVPRNMGAPPGPTPTKISTGPVTYALATKLPSVDFNNGWYWLTVARNKTQNYWTRKQSPDKKEGTCLQHVPSAPTESCGDSAMPFQPIYSNKICEVCSKPFVYLIRTAKAIRRGYGRFCSIQCRNKATTLSTIDLFFKYVGTKQKSGCILWTGRANSAGYGTTFVNGKHMTASRVSWELFVGPVPDGLEVCHNCPGGDRSLCINPVHFFLGTHKQNMIDMSLKGKSTRGERSSSSKLTNEIVSSIRIRRRNGETQAALAKEFGVTGSVISEAVRGITWRNVPMPEEIHTHRIHLPLAPSTSPSPTITPLKHAPLETLF